MPKKPRKKKIVSDVGLPETDQIEVDKEFRITLLQANKLLGVTHDTHWVRAIMEQTQEYKPYSYITLQAIKRS